MRQAVLIAALLMVCAPAMADDYSAKDLNIQSPATLATPYGLTSAAIYVVVDNPVLEPDQLLSVSTSWAEEAGFSNTTVENGQVHNQPIGDILIMPGATTVLGPDGEHIMLSRLRRNLQKGDEVPLTLTFAKAGPRDIKVEVLSGKDFVKLYPLQTTLLTIKKLQSEQMGKMAPPSNVME